MDERNVRDWWKKNKKTYSVGNEGERCENGGYMGRSEGKQLNFETEEKCIDEKFG